MQTLSRREGETGAVDPGRAAPRSAAADGLRVPVEGVERVADGCRELLLSVHSAIVAASGQCVASARRQVLAASAIFSLFHQLPALFRAASTQPAFGPSRPTARGTSNR